MNPEKSFLRSNALRRKEGLESKIAREVDSKSKKVEAQKDVAKGSEDIILYDSGEEYSEPRQNSGRLEHKIPPSDVAGYSDEDFEHLPKREGTSKAKKNDHWGDGYNEKNRNERELRSKYRTEKLKRGKSMAFQDKKETIRDLGEDDLKQAA